MNQEESNDTTIWGLPRGGQTETDRLNSRQLTRWSFVWALLIVAAAWTLKFAPLPDLLKWPVALAPSLVALVVLRSYLRFLRMTDELLRRIHLEGAAVAFGTGYIFAIGYLVAQAAGAPPLGLEVLILLMTGAWLVGNVLALKHYQ